MKNFKTKSFTEEFTDLNIINKSSARRFISFEAVVRDFHEKYRITEKPIGYNVTEEGVELLYK